MTNGFSDARNNFPGREPTGKWQVSDYCLTNCQAPSKLATSRVRLHQIALARVAD